MEKASKFIIDVVPLTRIPLDHQQHFSYLYREKIPEGSLVSIPLFRWKVPGIVVANRSDFHRFGNIRLKEVAEIVEENFLTAAQLKLAAALSDYYVCSLGIVLKLFCPKRIKERIKKNELSLKKVIKKIKLTLEQQHAISKITNNNLKLKIKNLKFLLYGPAGSGKTEVYIHSILKLKEKNKNAQFLILLPELTLTPQAVERYGQYFKPEEIAVINSKISQGQLYSNWQKIRSGAAKIIIGSRMAVFAPFQNLGLLVIDEEQDMSFKQWDRNPRYDARTAAEKLAAIHGAKLVFGSATPSIEAYFRAINKEIKLLTLPQLEIRNSKFETQNPIELVDMRKEKWKRNFSPLSKTLQGELKYALKNNLQTILFINRQGMSAFSVCAGCKTVLRCPQCERALIYTNSGDYKCLHCNYASGAIVECSHCKGATFKNIGLGTQKIESEIRKLFPGARTARADSGSMKKAGAQEKLYLQFARGEIDILIGTQMITKGWDLPNVALVGIIDADSLLNLPDFRNNEKAFQLIAQVAGRTNRPGYKFPGKVLLQTFDPNNTLLKQAAAMNYAAMFAAELEEREALHYPPFGRIIKLVNRHKNKAKLEQAAQQTYADLRAAIRKDSLIRITEPQDPLVSKSREIFKKQIILKLNGTEPEIPAKLRTVLQQLNSSWIIDIDPISVI